ncbi:MAG: ABC transporter permease [Denitrovibrio sp.]|nr:MAG: ABC transporter permease [Denitrovibrio sp.]
MKKILISTLLVLSVSTAFAGDMVKIGISQIVEHPALDAARDGIIKSLESCGYVAGQNVEFDTQSAQGNMVTANQIANKFAGDKKDLVVGIATPTALSLINTFRKLAPQTPVIFSAVTDPVGAKMVSNLEKPGGSVTGVSDLAPIDAQFGLIFDLGFTPKAVGIIYNSGEQNSRSQLELAKVAAKKRGVELVERAIANSSGVYAAAQSMVGKVQAIYVTTDNTVVSALESVVKIAYEHNIPLIMSDTDSVKRGALAAKGFDYYKHGEQTGRMVCRILKGEKPGDISVEFQADLKLLLNEKAAKEIGYSFSADMLKLADEVIK